MGFSSSFFCAWELVELAVGSHFGVVETGEKTLRCSFLQRNDANRSILLDY